MTKGKVGRPKLEIDEIQVERLAEIYCSNEEISYILACSVDTLERRFAEVIKRGKAKGRAKLRRLQWQCAEKNNPQMLIHLGRQLLGQNDQQNIEISHIDKTKEIQELKEKLKAVYCDER